ncbi:MAG: zinc metallopeptidase [Firmicutes bacterium]|jgi:Zn-dependent membrane protease YugP|nr:zinc metallopeptidase [Bacillota bacterium]
MYLDSTYLLLIPAMLLAAFAQMKVSSAFANFKTVQAQSGLTGLQIARQLLDQNGLYDVGIEQVQTELGDHYDPTARVVRLSPDVYNGSSVASVSVAAHETGHAVQHQQGYSFLNFRTAFFPVANIGSQLAWPIFFVGLMFQFDMLLNVGILLFVAAVIFQVVTLPVELDASNRARKMLVSGGYVTAQEEKGVKSVLDAAALTYVAAMFMSLMQLVRLIALRNNRRRD